MWHVRLLLPNVLLVGQVLVLLDLVVVVVVVVVRGFIVQVIIHHVPKTTLQHHPPQGTIVPVDPPTREDHVNQILLKQFFVLPLRGPIPPHPLYQN
jgi:hypothetical protein